MIQKTLKNLFWKGNRHYQNVFINKTVDFDELHKDKREVNSNAITETQLVGMDKYAKEATEEVVDIEKIKELRSTIRRRYANRKNFQKIYKQWDVERKGVVTVNNIFEMLKKFGFNVNLNEAKVLLASADKDKSNDLNMEEFMDLIFSQNEALNVDVSSLNSYFELIRF